MLLVQFISVNCSAEGFTAVIRDKCYGWAGKPPWCCSIFWVASPKCSRRTAEVKLKVWWWEGTIGLLLPGWEQKSDSSEHWRYPKGNELALWIGPGGLQINPATATASKMSAMCPTYFLCPCNPTLCFSEIMQTPYVCALSNSKL